MIEELVPLEIEEWCAERGITIERWVVVDDYGKEFGRAQIMFTSEEDRLAWVMTFCH